MSITAIPVKRRTSNRLYDAFWKRQLTQYPDTWPRLGYLAIVVLTTIMLYYLYYVEGAVTPLMLPYYHMSFQYFLYLLVVSNAIGAFTAFIGGLSDKIGRANLTIYGTLVVAAHPALRHPAHPRASSVSPSPYCVIGFVEGIILVSTPALMRDFSPQMGRGVGHGLLGARARRWARCAPAWWPPTRSTTSTPWQDQFVISGMVCMVVVVIAFVVPARALPATPRPAHGVRARAGPRRGPSQGYRRREGDSAPDAVDAALDLIASSIAISVFLLIYFASVSVLTMYWVVIFNRTTAAGQRHQHVVLAARIVRSCWWSSASLSDRSRVRKPFMVVGASAPIVMTVLPACIRSTTPHTGYYSNVLVVVLLGLSIAMRLHAVDGELHRAGRGPQPRSRRLTGSPCGAGSCGSWSHCRSSSSPASSPPPPPWWTTRTRPPTCRPSSSLSPMSPPPGTSIRRPRRQVSSRR